ncbi:hypothetical protein RhiJN_21321 [Ceratobasidium sp. AG-Ba]|nr:hypothetical protein RhiJN_21321 [Ceratobasidium sp. AG-Ba]
MLFGGGEFLMELVDTISVAAFDNAWVEFCRYYNATAAEKTAKYGQTFNSGGFEQLYAKLQAYAGQRLNDTNQKQLAWNRITSATTFGNPVKVGGLNVIEPINEIIGLNTNDAASFSLAQYAVLAIAPELAPDSFLAKGRSKYADSVVSSSTIVASTYREKNTGPSVEKPKKKRGVIVRILYLLGLRGTK